MIDQGLPEVEPVLSRDCVLKPGEVVRLEIEKPIIGYTPVVAQIEVGGVGEGQDDSDIYSVIDLRSADHNQDGTKAYMGYSFDPSLDFLIVAKDPDFDRGSGYKGLRVSEGAVQMGRFDKDSMTRGDIRSRFQSNNYTSPNHFSIQVTEEGLAIKDTNSLYGTKVKVDTNVQLKIVDSSNEQEIQVVRDNARDAITKYLDEVNDSQYDVNIRSRVKELANRIINKADVTLINEVAEIVINQSLDGIPLTKMLGKWNIHQQYDKRLRILSVLERDPDAAKAIVANNIGGFHGSQSGSLWGVLNHDGLLSAAEARTRGQLLSNGERTYSKRGGQRSISFADYREARSIAQYAGVETDRISVEMLQEQYNQLVRAAQESEEQWGVDHPFVYNAKNAVNDLAAQIEFMKSNPNSLETWLMQENFPIAYGLSLKDIETVATLNDGDRENKIVERVSSGIDGEFLYMGDHVSLDHLPVVAVPERYIEDVRRIFAINGKSAKIIDISLLTD